MNFPGRMIYSFLMLFLFSPSWAAPSVLTSSDTVRDVERLMAQNDLCAAAGKLYEVGIAQNRDRHFRPLWESMTSRISKLSTEEYMLCISTYNSVIGMMPGDGPSSFVILLGRSKKLLDKKDYVSAKKYFDRLNMDYPNDGFYPWFLLYRSECDAALGDKAAAIKGLEQLLSLYPNHSLAKEARDRREKLRN